MGGCCGGNGGGHGHGEERGHGGESMGHQKPMTATKTITTGIEISDPAAEKLKSLMIAEKKGPEYGLRLGVTGGGCSGLSYMMDFDTEKPEDKVYSHEATGVRVFIDPKSHLYVNGAVLDYQDGLMGAGFSISNPNSKGSCGCGSSFQA